MTTDNRRMGPVPRDRILECPEGFPKPDKQRVLSLFSLLHKKSELVYNGDGSWGAGCSDRGVFDNVKTNCSRPLMRKSYSRLSAYLNMAGDDPSGVYLARAREAAGFLCGEQREDGYFPYYLDESGWPLFTDSRGIMYVTGFSARALFEAFLGLNEPSYLNPAFRACVWGARFPSYSNYNYNSIVIGMLACGWEVFRKPENLAAVALPDYEPARRPYAPEYNYPGYFLNQAVSKTTEAVLTGQQPNGGYLGHNSWIWYHGIITEANALLLQALPPEHPDYGRIKESLTANMNYIVINLLENGSLYANYEVSHTAEGSTLHVIKALLQARKIFREEADKLLGAIFASFLEQVGNNPGSSYNQEKKVSVECVESHMEGLSLLCRV